MEVYILQPALSTFLPPLPRFPSFPDCISLLWLLQLLLLSAVTVLPVGGWKLDRLCRHGTDKAEIAGLFTNKIQTSFFAEKALMFLLTAEGFLSNKLGAPGLIYGTGGPPRSLNLGVGKCLFLLALAQASATSWKSCVLKLTCFGWLLAGKCANVEPQGRSVLKRWNLVEKFQQCWWNVQRQEGTKWSPL